MRLFLRPLRGRGAFLSRSEMDRTLWGGRAIAWPAAMAWTASGCDLSQAVGCELLYGRPGGDSAVVVQNLREQMDGAMITVNATQ